MKWRNIKEGRKPKEGQHIIVHREGKPPFGGQYEPLQGLDRCLDYYHGKWWSFQYWMPAPKPPENH